MRAVIYIGIVLGLLIPCLGTGQQDTTEVLTFEKFLEIVKEHHPMAKRADLQERLAESELLISRGNFDPMLFGQLNQKYFDETQYYDLLDAGLKIPTWFGVELYSGIEQTDGFYLNPENSTPNTGLWYTGLSVPLGQNLFIDERRAMLKRAKIFVESSREQRKLMYNDLLRNASFAYWDWFKQYNKVKVYEEAVEVAQERLDATLVDASIGERPSIDTVEADIQVQNRKIELQQAQLDFKNASALISFFIWAEGVIPLELEANTVPPRMDESLLRPVDPVYWSQLDTLQYFHPELQVYQYNIEQMKVQQQLKREMLKPRVNLKYNLLSEPITGSPLNAFAINNYRWGVDVAYPLFIRRERGELRLTNLEIQDLEYSMAGTVAELNYEIKAAINEWETTNDQFKLFSRTVRDYETLLEGERELFDVGESSLFLVNAREVGFINAQVRLIDILTKNRKAAINTAYTSGLLFD